MDLSSMQHISRVLHLMRVLARHTAFEAGNSRIDGHWQEMWRIAAFIDLVVFIAKMRKIVKSRGKRDHMTCGQGTEHGIHQVIGTGAVCLCSSNEANMLKV